MKNGVLEKSRENERKEMIKLLFSMKTGVWVTPVKRLSERWQILLSMTDSAEMASDWGVIAEFNIMEVLREPVSEA